METKSKFLIGLSLLTFALVIANTFILDALFQKIDPAPQQTSCNHPVINESTDDFYIGQIRYNASNPFDTLFIKIVAIKQDHCQYVFINDETKKPMKWRHTRRISTVTDVYDEVYNERD